MKKLRHCHLCIFTICFSSVEQKPESSFRSLLTGVYSIAERGGCFQRRLFVGVFVGVCLFVRTITSEKDDQTWLAVRYFVQKSHPSSMVKGQRSRSPGTKKQTAESSPLTMHGRACAVPRAYHQQTIPLRGRPGVTGYAGGKISACCQVLLLRSAAMFSPLFFVLSIWPILSVCRQNYYKPHRSHS